jgi:hypothetical protein
MVVVVVVRTDVDVAGSVRGQWFSGLDGCEGPKTPAVVPADHCLTAASLPTPGARSGSPSDVCSTSTDRWSGRPRRGRRAAARSAGVVLVYSRARAR